MFNVLRCCDQMVIVLFEQAVIVLNMLSGNVPQPGSHVCIKHFEWLLNLNGHKIQWWDVGMFAPRYLDIAELNT